VKQGQGTNGAEISKDGRAGGRVRCDTVAHTIGSSGISRSWIHRMYDLNELTLPHFFSAKGILRWSYALSTRSCEDDGNHACVSSVAVRRH
jgi:hypothetical protein